MKNRKKDPFTLYNKRQKKTQPKIQLKFKLEQEKDERIGN